MNNNEEKQLKVRDNKPGGNPKKNILLYSIIVISALVIIIAAIAGFSSYSKSYVASIGKMKVTVPEYSFMLMQEKANMLDIAGNPDPATFWETTITGGEKAIDIAKRKALENVRDIKMQVSKAKEQNIVLDKDDLDYINQLTQSLISQYNNDKAQANTAIIQAYGVNLKEFEDIYKQYMLGSKFIQSEMENVEANLEEIETYYNKFPDAFKDSSYRVGGQEAVWVKHILVLTIDENDEALKGTKLEAATKKAEDLLERVKGGEDFAKVATENSEDPGSAQIGGDYLFTKGYMDPEFEKVSFELEPGQISNLVKSSYGYHIIKLEEKIAEGEPVSLRCAKEYAEFQENAVKNAKYLEKMEDWRKDDKYKVKKNEKVFKEI